jgi:hypothetical protein
MTFLFFTIPFLEALKLYIFRKKILDTLGDALYAEETDFAKS